MSVRTPMQWWPDPGGGFSPAARLVRPLAEGAFGPANVSVAGQRRGEDSLLRFLTRLIHARRESPELGWGTSTLLENDPPALLAHRCDWQDSTVLTVHNLSPSPVRTDLDLGERVEGVEDLLENREHQVDHGRLRVDLAAYGYLWLRARRASAGPT